MKPRFITPLTYTEMEDGWIRVERPFGFVSSRGEVVLVPVGRISNMASIPFLPLRLLFRRNGSYGDAAVVHDDLVDEQHIYLDPIRHTVLPLSSLSVLAVVSRMPGMTSIEFDAAIISLNPVRRKIAWQDSVRIFAEAMACPPRVTCLPVRQIITGAVWAFGPKW